MNSDFFAREDVTYENCPEMRLREVSRLLIDSGIENGNNEARQLFLKFGGLSKSDVLFGDAVSSAPELYYAIKRRLKIPKIKLRTMRFLSLFISILSINQSLLIPIMSSSLKS